MSWLTNSFSEYTVIWLLLSSVLGGFVGAGITFVREDLLRPFVSNRRETERVVKRYTTPLLRSAEALERRINILVRNERRGWYEDDEYYRMSTLFVFGQYLGWVHILEREFGFLPVESLRKGKEFQHHLNGLFRALSSFSYFRSYPDQDAVGVSQVPRLMLTAVGESVTIIDESPRTMDFTDFLQRYGRDAQFRRWFAELDEFLRLAHPTDPVRWDRLIAGGANLRALTAFLDPDGRMVSRRPVANLQLASSADTRTQLEEDLGSLLHVPRKRPRAFRRRPGPKSVVKVVPPVSGPERT
jgi:hypothetical protein